MGRGPWAVGRGPWAAWLDDGFGDVAILAEPADRCMVVTNAGCEPHECSRRAASTLSEWGEVAHAAG